MPAIYHKYSTVTENDLQIINNDPKLSQLFKIINIMADIPFFPKHWLITSVNHSYKTGYERKVTKPNTSHQRWQAVDVVPLVRPNKLILPVPLNRNFLLMRTMKAIVSKLGINNLPVIAFEPEHIHCDKITKGGIAIYNKARPYLDKSIYTLAQSNEYVSRAIDSKELIYI